jgi:organic hydroperoxide reductase OsmC/OhrA
MTVRSGEGPSVVHKTFTFRTNTIWTGARSGILSAGSKPDLPISVPPEFKGEQGVWSSEEMFVASVETCHMTTFLTYAEKESITIEGYRSHANGVLEYIDGDYRFTRIVIFPTITIPPSVDEGLVHAILREAQKHCLVANSIASIVEVNPTIMTQGER